MGKAHMAEDEATKSRERRGQLFCLNNKGIRCSVGDYQAFIHGRWLAALYAMVERGPKMPKRKKTSEKRGKGDSILD